MLDTVVLRPAALTLLLALGAVGRNHVGWAAEFGERRLDGRPCGLLRLQEDEFMLVGYDHAAGGVAAFRASRKLRGLELIAEEVDLAPVPARHDIAGGLVIIIPIAGVTPAEFAFGARQSGGELEPDMIERALQIL